ncbi:MAG: ribose 5-phosphate isomerase B [Nanoarchaeota archaeon]|nr:ribose 5-phosphate isomerase B [DPANN group archaeon]MBL7117023.1 ribose 5-phosphate isomerase B [Nanoarchaeota archaeon]
MKIFLGADHAGFKLKEEVKEVLSSLNIEFEDMSPAFEESDDYPDHALKVTDKVLETGERGILICGTGVGMSIAANKVPGIRAALCRTAYEAELSREHNNTNILVLQGWNIRKDEAEEIIRSWLRSPFEGGRHERRVNKIIDIEKKYSK